MDRVGWNINMVRFLPVTNLAGPAVFSGIENTWGLETLIKWVSP